MQGRGPRRLCDALQVLAPYAREININDKVMALYLDHLIPGITEPGTDNNYGSSAMYDVLALQVLEASLASRLLCGACLVLCVESWAPAVPHQ